MNQPPLFSQSYIGIPFRDLGREKHTGLDCWGLVRLVLKEQKQIDVPMYEVSEGDHPNVETEILTAQKSGEWIQVITGRYRAFDVAEMSIPVKVSGLWEFLPLHVGILADTSWLLHTERATCSRLSNVHDRRIGSRILGFWRHRLLT